MEPKKPHKNPRHKRQRTNPNWNRKRITRPNSSPKRRMDMVRMDNEILKEIKEIIIHRKGKTIMKNNAKTGKITEINFRRQK